MLSIRFSLLSHDHFSLGGHTSPLSVFVCSLCVSRFQCTTSSTSPLSHSLHSLSPSSLPVNIRAYAKTIRREVSVSHLIAGDAACPFKPRPMKLFPDRGLSDDKIYHVLLWWWKRFWREGWWCCLLKGMTCHLNKYRSLHFYMASFLLAD